MSGTLAPETINILKTTAPVVAQNGNNITKRMYEIMTTEHPQVRDLFNMSHLMPDKSGISPQARTVANAIIAYAGNCDNLPALGDAVEMMAEKHVSFNILPEHYKIVGSSILKAIKDVLGDAATEDIMKSWEDGYWFLANLLISIEERKKAERENAVGGWRGYKEMIVAKKVKESDLVMSFYLKHRDGKTKVPTFKPGQYLSFRFPKEVIGTDNAIVRNYSLSCCPGNEYLRVSIKREVGEKAKIPPGLASNHFHDKVKEGDLIQVGVPCGSFFLDESSARPVVLVGAGIGLTPMVSMLEKLVGSKTKVVYIQCCTSEQEHPMKDHINGLVSKAENVSAYAFYSRAEATANSGDWKIFSKRHLDMESLAKIVPSPVENNDYYFCGPQRFLDSMVESLTKLKVPTERHHYEYFGPTQ